MTWGMVAVAGAGLVGGYMSSKAAGSAADAQTNAATAATGLQQQQYDQQRADNMPALQARNASLAHLQKMLGIDGGGSMSASPTAAQVQAEPGYQFGLDQGQQALNRQAAARGMSNSGAALMAAQRYGTDYAGTKYNDAWNRMQSGQQNEYNRLAGVAGLGQVGASQVGQAGASYANNAGNIGMSAANAQGAAGMAQANTWGGAVNNLAGWYSNSQRNAAAGGNQLSGPSNAQLEQQWWGN